MATSTSTTAADLPEYQEQRSDKKHPDDNQPPSPNALKVAATDCLNSWICYLQMLNSLCSAGLKLSHSLINLSQSQNVPLANQCTVSWDELTRATIVASNTVKTHIAAAMQDMMIGETFTEADAQRQQEHNQLIITENILTFINLQYQFSIAGCECLSSMAMCPSCQAAAGGTHEPDCNMAFLQQSFARTHHAQGQESHSQMSSPHFPLEKSSLDSPKEPRTGEYSRQQHSPSSMDVARGSSPFHETIRGPSPVHYQESMRNTLPLACQLHAIKSPYPGRGSRSPLHFPLFPLSGQRRWSEVAAGDVRTEAGDSVMRRWSMPWDCGRPEASNTGGTSTWHQRYLPSKLSLPSSGGQQERSRSTTPEAAPQPPGTITSGEGLAEAIQLLSCRPMRYAVPHDVMPRHSLQGPPYTVWSETHEERMHRRMYPSQRGNWQSIDVPQTSGMSVTEHYDIFPSGQPLTSRKSSSSTDSSSCLSIHSRSTTSSSERGSDSFSGAGESIRLHTNLYSMWSGNEHLPFIRLPESQEPQDDSDAEDTPTDKNIYPKPI